MDFVGELKDITRSFDGQTVISYEIGNITHEQADKLASMGLTRITLKKYRQRRSLDANALLWACIGEIAEALKADKWDVYLQMLKRYGQYTYICVKPNVVDEVKAQWRESEIVGEIDIHGQKAVQMLCYFGSSTYNSKEFSVLIDGVLSEMEDMGLDKPLSSDIRRAIDGIGNQ